MMGTDAENIGVHNGQRYNSRKCWGVHWEVRTLRKCCSVQWAVVQSSEVFQSTVVSGTILESVSVNSGKWFSSRSVSVYSGTVGSGTVLGSAAVYRWQWYNPRKCCSGPHGTPSSKLQLETTSLSQSLHSTLLYCNEGAIIVFVATDCTSVQCTGYRVQCTQCKKCIQCTQCTQCIVYTQCTQCKVYILQCTHVPAVISSLGSS